MDKREAWGNAFYIFFIGFVVFFWATSPTFLGLWIGICLAYGFSQSKGASKSKTISQIKSTHERIDLNGLKEYVNDTLSLESGLKKKTHNGSCYYSLNIKTKNNKYDVFDINHWEEVRRIYVRQKFQNDPEFAQRFLAVENLTQEELQNLKTKHILPNKFTEEEKQYAVYPFWRDREGFGVGGMLDLDKVDHNKTYSNGCYEGSSRRPDAKLVFINEKFKEINGYDLFE